MSGAIECKHHTNLFVQHALNIESPSKKARQDALRLQSTTQLTMIESTSSSMDTKGTGSDFTLTPDTSFNFSDGGSATKSEYRTALSQPTQSTQSAQPAPPAQRGVFYWLYTLWLLTISDIKAMVLPETACGIFGALSGAALTTNTHPDVSAILWRFPLVLLWNWLNVLLFDLSNQRLPAAIVEDAINKSWRPIPAGRLTATEATKLLMLVIAVVYVESAYLGGLHEAVVVMVLTWMHNDLRGGDESKLYAWERKTSPCSDSGATDLLPQVTSYATCSTPSPSPSTAQAACASLWAPSTPSTMTLTTGSSSWQASSSQRFRPRTSTTWKAMRRAVARHCLLSSAKVSRAGALQFPSASGVSSALHGGTSACWLMVLLLSSASISRTASWCFATSQLIRILGDFGACGLSLCMRYPCWRDYSQHISLLRRGWVWCQMRD